MSKGMNIKVVIIWEGTLSIVMWRVIAIDL
jgi:hypothetical protein